MEDLTKRQEILLRIFKDIEEQYNSRSISKKVGMSHAGAFKVLKTLEKQGIVKSKEIGKSRVYSLILDNPITIKEIEMALLIEAQRHKRWCEEFKGVKELSKFVILFGSILRKEKEARDVDVLVVAENNKFKEIKGVIEKINSISAKKIHLLLQNKNEFEEDIRDKNKAMLEVIKGIVIQGQEEVVKLLR